MKAGMRRRVGIFFGLLFCAGIGAVMVRGPAPSPPKADPKVFGIGEISDSGRLVFYHNGASGFELERDYGFILINENFGSLEPPKAVYRLATNATKTVTDESDWNRFRSILDSLPRGTIIDRFSTCMVPQSYGLRESVMTEFEDYCRLRGLVIRDELNGLANGICTCKVR